MTECLLVNILLSTSEIVKNLLFSLYMFPERHRPSAYTLTARSVYVSHVAKGNCSSSLTEPAYFGLVLLASPCMASSLTTITNFARYLLYVLMITI